LNLPVKNPLSDIPEISKNEAKGTEFQLDLIDLMLSDYSEALLDLCIEYDGVQIEKQLEWSKGDLTVLDG